MSRRSQAAKSEPADPAETPLAVATATAAQLFRDLAEPPQRNVTDKQVSLMEALADLLDPNAKPRAIIALLARRSGTSWMWEASDLDSALATLGIRSASPLILQYDAIRSLVEAVDRT